ncbi:hypothetical protein QWY14_06585 [Planococcus sp. N028]|uniref:Uncharacterized protein n=1 Tax=Planococcus shixiaomingii TaxID=3058393 RepID=A0ABT8N0P0_9BACL|nr:MULTISPECIES: hypothetical protein [unclassified Planococcus (in: firmicutes)]MDN7241451.1 hypothetical protein [Planococcus sp. N028]WKA53705.1 hypothetical protein QWY21_13660 [Planococcus sp. N022]
MKKSLYKITAPALAFGLALSVQGGAYAASPGASAETKAHFTATAGKEAVKVNAAHHLTPVQKRISSVNGEVAKIAAKLESKESLTSKEYYTYQKQLTSLVNRLNASNHQFKAISKKFKGSEETAKVEAAIKASFASSLHAHELLNSIEVVKSK